MATRYEEIPLGSELKAGYRVTIADTKLDEYDGLGEINIDLLIEDSEGLRGANTLWPISRLDDYKKKIAKIEKPVSTATVILFKQSGKYYTTEEWKIPEGSTLINDMKESPDFHRIDGGAVLIPEQDPWGFPQLFPGEGK